MLAGMAPLAGGSGAPVLSVDRPQELGVRSHLILLPVPYAHSRAASPLVGHLPGLQKGTTPF